MAGDSFLCLADTYYLRGNIWNRASTEVSPFAVQVFSLSGLPRSRGYHEFLFCLTAVLSSSRNLRYIRLLPGHHSFTLSVERGSAQGIFKKQRKKGIPLNGIFLTTLCIFTVCFLSYLCPRPDFKLPYGHSWIHSFIIGGSVFVPRN